MASKYMDLSFETLKSLARLEMTVSELYDGNYFLKIRAEVPYFITLDDVKCGLQHLADSGDARWELVEDWAFLREDFEEVLIPAEEDDIELPAGLMNSAEFIERMRMDISLLPFFDPDFNVTPYIERIDEFKAQMDKPYDQRKFQEYELEDFVRAYADRLQDQSPELIAFWRDSVENLCARDNSVGYQAKGYACYGGNPAYACDWFAARDCIHQAFTKDQNPYYANTLGYIYYYGRCNAGVPEYDKALQYFTIGAAAGVEESRYKLADMFNYGYGVDRCPQIAQDVIEELYDDNLVFVQNEFFDCKFADIALRMGDMVLDGKCSYSDNFKYSHALYYYLQADYAIRRRMELGNDYYGDEKVASYIQNSLETAIDRSMETEPLASALFEFEDIMDLLSPIFERGSRVSMKYTRLKNGELNLTFEADKEYRGYKRSLFLTLPMFHYCGHVKWLKCKTKGLEQFGDINHQDQTSGTIIFDDYADGYLYLNSDVVCVIDTKVIVKAPSEKDECVWLRK